MHLDIQEKANPTLIQQFNQLDQDALSVSQKYSKSFCIFLMQKKTVIMDALYLQFRIAVHQNGKEHLKPAFYSLKLIFTLKFCLSFEPEEREDEERGGVEMND